jgi:hypothetical protein
MVSYWIAGGRQSGKTTAALKWLMRGEPVTGSPGWSRMFVMSHGETMRGYVKSLLSKLWIEEGREGKPPFDALITPTELFSPKYFRGRTQALQQLTYAIDQFDSIFRRSFPSYNEVLSRINVEVFTMDGYPYQEEFTPSQFMSLLDSAATEETP